MKKIFIAAVFFCLTHFSFPQVSDSIFVVLSGDTIYIWNTGVYENCASNFLMSVSRTADTVTVKEIDIATEYATCMCYFDLNVAVTGYPPGNYYVKVFRKLPLVNPDTLFYIGSATFSYGGSSLAYHTYNYQSQCYEPSYVDKEEKIPERFQLLQNYPNPFNPETKIRYQIPDAGYVKLSVYDVLGNEVERLEDEYQMSGSHESTFYSYDIASGIYVVALQYNGSVEARKMVVLK